MIRSNKFQHKTKIQLESLFWADYQKSVEKDTQNTSSDGCMAVSFAHSVQFKVIPILQRITETALNGAVLSEAALIGILYRSVVLRS